MKSEVSSSLVCNLDQMTYLSPQGSSVLGTFQARILEWVAISSSWDLPDPGTEPRSSALQVGSLPSEPPVYRVHFIEEETLKFYITSCSFCLCNSDYSLQSLDHIGHVVSESGDLQYQKLELVSLTLVLLFAIAQPLQTSLIMPVHVKVRHPSPHLDCCCAGAKPLILNQPSISQCCPL